ncbi:MAG: PEGA domain-containing protein [Polyangiaceae bacterium]
MPGYESATSEPISLTVGGTVDVQLSLKRILGTVTLKLPVELGAQRVVVDSEPARNVSGITSFELPPGRHSIAFQAPGYEAELHSFEVIASSVIEVQPRLQTLSGNLSVATDERDAEIEVDGKHLGFTPSVVSVPVGAHVVRVILPGFKTSTHTVVIREGDTTRLDVELLKVEEVSAASRSTELVGRLRAR